MRNLILWNNFPKQPGPTFDKLLQHIANLGDTNTMDRVHSYESPSDMLYGSTLPTHADACLGRWAGVCPLAINRLTGFNRQLLTEYCLNFFTLLWWFWIPKYESGVFYQKRSSNPNTWGLELLGDSLFLISTNNLAVVLLQTDS